MILYVWTKSTISDPSNVVCADKKSGLICLWGKQNKEDVNKIFFNFLLEACLFFKSRGSLLTHVSPKNIFKYYTSQRHSSHSDSWKSVLQSLHQLLLGVYYQTHTRPVGKIATHELCCTVPEDQSLWIQI